MRALDSLGTYMLDVGRYPVGVGSGSRDDLITGHLRLVLLLAKRIPHPPQVSLAELVAEGNLGLCEAADRFDPDRGVGFASLAGVFVKRAIRAYLRSTPWGPIATPKVRNPRDPLHLEAVAAARSPEKIDALSPQVDPAASPSCLAEEAPEEESESLRLFGFEISVMKPRKRLIFERKRRGDSEYAIAKDLGISKQAVNAAVKQEVARMQAKYRGGAA